MERKLTAILSADVAGYSRLMGDDEEGTLHTLTAYRKLIDTLIVQHRGRVVGSAGDSVLAEFASVVDAAQCAVVIQATLKAENVHLPDSHKMAFRIGINLGDVMVDGDQIYGDGVNIAARLESLAAPGGICISGTVHEHIKNKLALSYEDLGEQQVKNIAEPVRVWWIRSEESESQKAKSKGQKAKVESQRNRRVGAAHRSRMMLGLAGLLLAGGIATALYFILPSFRIPHSAIRIQGEGTLPLLLPDKPSIAVLPFTNISGDPEQEYFGDGITVDLITDLTKFSGLLVTARCSAFTYKGKTAKVQDVGRELGVRYVLGGSVRKVGDRVLITAQLVDAATGGQVWAERYDRPLQDLFAVQEEVRQKILASLALKLTDEDHERLERAYTPRPEAYDYLRRAQEFYFRGTPADNTRARQLCEKAIELDSTYAAAYSLLASTYFVEWVNQWSHNPQTVERAFALARQTLNLDDSWLGAHELLALIYLLRDKQHEQALAVVQRSLAQAPNWFAGYVALGVILNSMGRPQETIGLQEQAMRLSPQSDRFLPVLGGAYRLMGQYEEAITSLKRALAVNRNRLDAHLDLVATYSEIGREEEARAEAAEALRLSPQFSLEAFGQRLAYKDPTEAERHLAALRKAGLK